MSGSVGGNAGRLTGSCLEGWANGASSVGRFGVGGRKMAGCSWGSFVTVGRYCRVA